MIRVFVEAEKNISVAVEENKGVSDLLAVLMYTVNHEYHDTTLFL